MKLDSVSTFEMYTAIKTHFNSVDYDFFEYKGKLRKNVCTYKNLLKKNYCGAIEKLARTYESTELMDYFVSNMLVLSGKHIFDIDAEGKRVYTDYVRRKESRTYIFKQDVSRICMELEKHDKHLLWDSAIVTDGQHPLLFRMFVGGYISPETMCILYKLQDYISDWDSKISDTIFYPTVVMQISKLAPFIRFKNMDVFQGYIDEISENIISK